MAKARGDKGLVGAHVAFTPKLAANEPKHDEVPVFKSSGWGFFHICRGASQRLVIFHQADGIALAIWVVILTLKAHHHVRRRAGVRHGGNGGDDARQRVSFAPTKHRRARVPAVVDAALCARDPSLHWHGVRVQRVLAAAFAGNRDQCANRLQGDDVCAGDHHVDVRLAGKRPDVDV